MKILEFQSLKFGIQFWVKTSDEDSLTGTWKLFVIEFVITFGENLDDVHSNTLNNIHNLKTMKYGEFIINLRKKFE
jgi:hypothetical protein